MPSIIEEIQREALRPEARVGGLLRMVKLAAAKLKLTDVGDWVEHELNGYALGSTVPDYRVVKGELRAFNPFNGWIPITGPGVADLRAANKTGFSALGGDGETAPSRWPVGRDRTAAAA